MVGERTGLLWPWTEADVASIRDGHARGERVLCPLDSTPLLSREKEGTVTLRCLRCGNGTAFATVPPVTTEQDPR